MSAQRDAEDRERAVESEERDAEELYRIACERDEALAEVERLRARLRDETQNGDDFWLEHDVSGPANGKSLTLTADSVCEIVRHLIDKGVPRVADGCNRVVLRFHLVSARTDIEPGTVLFRTTRDAEDGGFRSEMHPKFRLRWWQRARARWDAWRGAR